MKSKVSHAVLDIESRKEKAYMITRLLNSYKNIKNSKVLDIGTGSGIIAHEIGKIGNKVYSVDIRDERIVKGNYKFKKIKDERLPFKSSEFDIIISNHVMAHVKNNELHLREIRRVLKKDGVVYLSMLNRLWPFEPNFGLLFLSWFPRRIADFYVRLVGKGRYYDVNPLSYRAFTDKIGKYFNYEDITMKVINQKMSMPNYAYKLLKLFSQVWVFVLKKRS